MKKLIHQLGLLATSILLITLASSCGGGSKNGGVAKVKPEKVEISGDLSDYLQIVDKEYEVVEDWGGNFSIKVKGIKVFPEDELNQYDFELTASLLTEDGTPVSGIAEFKMVNGSAQKLISLLKKGSGEEVIKFHAELGGYSAKQHADKSKKFSVASSMKQKEVESESSSSSGNSSNSSDNSSSSNDEVDIEKLQKATDKALEQSEKALDQFERAKKLQDN